MNAVDTDELLVLVCKRHDDPLPWLRFSFEITSVWRDREGDIWFRSNFDMFPGFFSRQRMIARLDPNEGSFERIIAYEPIEKGMLVSSLEELVPATVSTTTASTIVWSNRTSEQHSTNPEDIGCIDWMSYVR